MPERAHVFDAANDYEPSGFFMLRTPLLPLSEWHALSEDLRAPGCESTSSQLDAALRDDRRIVEARLAAALGRPEVREGVFLASPTLSQSLSRWLEAKEREPAAAQSLLRYVSRMTTRPTPFGLFAGYSTGFAASELGVRLAARERYQRRTRLDMECVAAIARQLEGSGAEHGLLYRPNTSLYEAAGRLRYVEDRREGRKRTYHLVAVERSDALTETLERAQHGATLAELSAALVGPEVSEHDARGFVSFLIERRILVSNLEPTLTGPDALTQLCNELGHESFSESRTLLARVSDELAALDNGALVVDLGRYRRIADELAPLCEDLELRALFQVDLQKPIASGGLDENVTRELKRAIALLHRLGTPRPDALADFRRAFSDRYDAEEVPLVEVLDEEIGIGFAAGSALEADASPLLSGLPFPSREGASARSFSERDTTLLRLLEKCWQRGSRVLELSDADVAALSNEAAPPLPRALAVVAVVLDSASPAKLLLHSVTGPSGARMLGRFCSGDAELCERVRAHTAAEESLEPEATFAEIVCQPQDRVGNVLARPVLRKFEIPYLGRSGAPIAQQIPVTDLRVRVVGERIILRSERLDREVIPRLSTAHYHSDTKNPALYRFLAALQTQGVASGLAWDWGPFEHASHLPRVAHRNFVLARERWNLEASELEPVRKASGAARQQLLRELRERLGIPRTVVMADDDNELVLDLENVLAVDAFVERIRGGAVLAEWLVGDGFCQGPEGEFGHEIVVPFVRRQADDAPRPRALSRHLQTVERRERTLAPGSDWLYAKLYGGEASLDVVLIEAIEPLRRAALESGAADCWFFIRYADPDSHLRVRFHGDSARLAAEVLPALERCLEPWLAKRALHRIELGTYEREIERYGGLRGVCASERLFQVESDAALSIVGATLGEVGQDARWRAALLGMHALYAQFEPNLERRAALTTKLRDGFAKEFHSDAALKDALRLRFRDQRALLSALLNEDSRSADDSALADLQPIFEARRHALEPIAAELRALEQENGLSCSVMDLLPSYAHLFVNRVLRSAPRAHEYVFYELLSAHYRSALGRARAQGRSGSIP